MAIKGYLPLILGGWFLFHFFSFFLVVIECTLFAPFTWTFRSVTIPDMKPKIWHDPLKKKSFASSGCNKMSFAVTWSRGNRILNWSVPLIRGESYKIDWYLLPTYFELFGTLGYRRATALHWDSQSVSSSSSFTYSSLDSVSSGSFWFYTISRGSSQCYKFLPLLYFSSYNGSLSLWPVVATITKEN